MKKKLSISALFVALFWVTSLLIMRAHAEDTPSSPRLPTYFTYSPQDVETLEAIETDETITQAQLEAWDLFLKDSLTQSNIGYYRRLRLYTYLYNAQRDAAFLSDQAHDHFAGSLDPISKAIVLLFLPDAPIHETMTSDDYSEALATIVLAKYRERYETEEALTFSYPSSSVNVASVGKWIPWTAKPASLFRPEPPPEQEKAWKKQLGYVKKAIKKRTPEQVQAIHRWADPQEGDWRAIANEYMFKNDIPLAKVLLVRSMLMIGLYDATIANLDAKFYYHTDRPSLRDPSIESVIPTPDSPSYPSGHSTLASTASTILSYYFPDDSDEWTALADESGKSRIWAGVHYPIDDETGRKLGRLIGCEIVLCEGDD